MPRHPTGFYAGKEIREHREKLGLTQSQVSGAWGRPNSNLHEIENDRRRISQEMYRRLKAVMDELAYYLWSEEALQHFAVVERVRPGVYVVVDRKSGRSYEVKLRPEQEPLVLYRKPRPQRGVGLVSATRNEAILAGRAVDAYKEAPL